MIASSATLQTCQKKPKKKSSVSNFVFRVSSCPTEEYGDHHTGGCTVGTTWEGGQAVSPLAPILWAYQLGEHTVRHLPRAVSSSPAAYPVVFLSAAPLPVSCPHTHTRVPSSSISCVPT